MMVMTMMTKIIIIIIIIINEKQYFNKDRNALKKIQTCGYIFSSISLKQIEIEKRLNWRVDMSFLKKETQKMCRRKKKEYNNWEIH